MLINHTSVNLQIQILQYSRQKADARVAITVHFNDGLLLCTNVNYTVSCYYTNVGRNLRVTKTTECVKNIGDIRYE